MVKHSAFKKLIRTKEKELDRTRKAAHKLERSIVFLKESHTLRNHKKLVGKCFRRIPLFQTESLQYYRIVDVDIANRKGIAESFHWDGNMYFFYNGKAELALDIVVENTYFLEIDPSVFDIEKLKFMDELTKKAKQ